MADAFKESLNQSTIELFTLKSIISVYGGYSFENLQILVETLEKQKKEKELELARAYYNWFHATEYKKCDEFDLSVIGVFDLPSLYKIVGKISISSPFKVDVYRLFENEKLLKAIVSSNSNYDDTKMPSFALPVFMYALQNQPKDLDKLVTYVKSFKELSGTCYRAGLRHILKTIDDKSGDLYKEVGSLYVTEIGPTISKLTNLYSEESRKAKMSELFEIIRAIAAGLIEKWKDLLREDEVVTILGVFIKNSAMDIDSETVEALLKIVKIDEDVAAKWVEIALKRKQFRLASVIKSKVPEEPEKESDLADKLKEKLEHKGK